MPVMRIGYILGSVRVLEGRTYIAYRTLRVASSLIQVLVLRGQPGRVAAPRPGTGRIVTPCCLGLRSAVSSAA